MNGVTLRVPTARALPRRRLRTTVALLGVASALITGCSGHRHAAPSPPASPPASSRAPTVAPHPAQVQEWLTTASGEKKLSQQAPISLKSSPGPAGQRPIISVDETQQFQQFWGVGASITGATAQLISRLSEPQRSQTLSALFSPSNGIGLSVLRQPIGANDFSIGNATYDDLAPGAQDLGLTHFGLGQDASQVLPLIRQAQQLNPAATTVLTPWSAPSWMKTTGSVVGGSLKAGYEAVYTRYLARAVQAYAAARIRVTAMSIQNEPSFTPPGYPGMMLTPGQQGRIVRLMKAALQSSGQSQVGIWALDDNYDRVSDAEQLVGDQGTRAALAGVAFHCYRGQPDQMAAFHQQHPNLPLAISECTGGDWSPKFSDNLRYDTQFLLIDGIRNGASWVSKWNAALDPNGGPTNNGCRNCRGVITINPDQKSISFNEAYYALGHVGKFVTRGAHVIASTTFGPGNLQTVAFLNPNGGHVLLVLNSADHELAFGIESGATSFGTTLPAGAVATYTW